jgi:DNA adenine methylase
MKQPFSYYGGKQRLAPRLIQLIPQHKVYAEPFCGGASLFFAKINPIGEYYEVLNDYDHRIINFFEVLRDNGKQLCHMLSFTPYSEKLYMESKHYNGDDALLKAYYFYINVNMSFSKDMNGGWSRSIKTKHNPNCFTRKVELLPEFIEKLQNVYLCCTDALKVIEQFDSPTTFFYCDPPYPQSHQGHYSGYTQQDFDTLVTKLENIHGNFMLSCYSHTSAPFNYFDYDCLTSACQGKTENRKRTERIYYRGIRENMISKVFSDAKFDSPISSDNFFY